MMAKHQVRPLRSLTFFLAMLFAALVLIPGAAHAQAGDVETAWRLLDYVAVDYGGAVESGRIKSAPEFAEMNEFSASVAARIIALPPKPERAGLIEGSRKLQGLIRGKASPAEVAALAHSLAEQLLRTYPVPLAPDRLPDPARGGALFASTCAACHGAVGDGHGPDAAKLATPPVAFTDAGRARQRSIFALYQVVTQGIDGTAMQSFSNLPAADRWAVAFHAGSLSTSAAQARVGEQLWKTDPTIRQRIPDLKTLVALTPAALAGQIGVNRADEIMAYLRRSPKAVQQAPNSLGLARQKLAASLAAYRAGDRKAAGDLALSAYLDGFEPVEPTLGARDSTLLARIEGAMGEYRAAIEKASPNEEVTGRADAIGELLDDADAALAPDAASATSTFAGAMTILLREGLEALLIVVAMIAFLRKAERSEVLPYVHAGWIGALLAGLVTWAIATYAIGISGANRELTEGFGSLFASIVLLSVGIWMHGKSQANQWQRYIEARMAHVLSGRSAWMLFGLAFVVVYREVFETILFYAALWAQGNGGALLGGAATAMATLAIIAWLMLRYSRTLPVAQFFRYSAWLMALLTIVLAGKGVAALQEAGIVGIASAHGVPRISMLGLFPTWQGIGAQAMLALATAAGFLLNARHNAAGKPVVT